MMDATVKGNDITRVFWSWDEYVEYAKGPTDMMKVLRSSQETSRSRDSFTKTKSFDEAIDLANQGWTDGLDRVATLARMIEPKIQPIIKARWESRYDVRGSAVSLPRWRRDHPRNMRRRVRVQKPVESRPVRLLVSCTYSSGISTETVQKRGALIISLVGAMRRAGKPIEIWIEHTIVGQSPKRHGNDQPRMIHLIRVAEPDQPIDMARLNFALAHPASLRRITFAASEREAKTHRTYYGIGGGYGWPGVPPADIIESYGDIHLARMLKGEKHWDDPEQAVTFVLDKLREIGVEIAE